MSSSSAMLFIGQQCSDKHCYMVDFLPFKCQHCSQMYCHDHFRPTDHQCEKFDATKHDRVAPSCPICNVPVAIPPDQDPNIRMTQHIENECGKGREEISKVPRCASGKCNKVLYAPIKCDACRLQFCAEHRFPSAHKCSIGTSPTAPKPTQGTATDSKAGIKLKQAVNTGSVRTATGMAAIKRAMKSQTEPKKGQQAPFHTAPSSTPSSSSVTSKTHHTSPFSKSDRLVANPLHSSISAHLQSNAPSTLSSNVTPSLTPISPKSILPGPQTSSCKIDVLLNSPTPITTSYAPPPLFTY